MSKLAGRLTYLGGGILAGVAIAAATLKYETLSNIIPENPQLLIAAITAITGVFSAFAAFQAASITRMAHLQAKRTTNARFNTAKAALENLQTITKKRLEADPDKDHFFNRTQLVTLNWYNEQALAGADATTNERERYALLNCAGLCQTVAFRIDQTDCITRATTEAFLDKLTENLEDLGIGTDR
ncbi:MAG: hypothetical protein GYB19_10065 [Rhodospirillales bacterium]|nr:hypothetical protein [Rhodospirillales bacterium]